METANPKLGRQDWVQAALETLMEKGIEAVKVDVLAKSLKITRGSFYWHFKNLDDLLAAIIQEWQAVNTEDTIKQVEKLDGTPSQQLLHLLEIAAKDDNRLEKAMRIWAIHDARVMASIKRVDRQRLDYLQHLFLQIGFSQTDAELRAQVTYSVKLGWVVMAPPRKPSERLTEIRFIYKILILTSFDEF
ncbi:TetR/AcrR family transcriptional regulator [Chamaesiphon sp. OTE_75_metabat_556]|uniref:TetR/AcrR family transcriptional regulator n=1 Tax=Chamaesiphon sp. OTE_75_metabat_556 TaxID=2964692 RepID=UPI00286AB9D3|nr:TetR/AcrR family transcriptional regulator [Chamaesiphon sp. OTE_75_metabat_556]